MGKKRKLLIGFLLVISLAGLWLIKPWLPYAEPEIQRILREIDSDARLTGFVQVTENCRIASALIPVGTMHVRVEIENGHWKYIAHAFEAGGLPPMIECPR